MTVMVCPSCKGRGLKRDPLTGEADDCPVCHGEGSVDGFACADPEGAWIGELESEREP